MVDRTRLGFTIERKGFADLVKTVRARIAAALLFHETQMLHGILIADLTDEEARCLWEPYRNGRRDADPVLRVLDGGPGEIVTKRCCDVVDLGDWYGSALVKDHCYPVRVGEPLYSEVRLSDGRLHRLSFTRDWNDPRFDEEDVARVHRYHQQLVAGWQAATGEVRLSPRARDVLDGLLRGESEKELCARLALGPSSIHREILALYRCFRVHNRAELIAASSAYQDCWEKQRRIDALSPRQRQTLALLLTNLTEKEISGYLGLSYHTLHSYVKATYEALGLRSRAQVVAEFAGQHIPMR